MSSGPFRDTTDPSLQEQHDDFRTWLSDRHCPVCRIAMYTGKKSKVSLDACGGCGGVWLTAEDAKHLLASNDIGFALIAAAAADGSEKREPPNRARLCPDCQTQLVCGHLKTGDINVDACATHGTWFDARELNQMVHHLTKAAEVPKLPAGLKPPTFDELVKQVLASVKDVLGQK